jgi:hypothetical protein
VFQDLLQVVVAVVRLPTMEQAVLVVVDEVVTVHRFQQTVLQTLVVAVAVFPM